MKRKTLFTGVVLLIIGTFGRLYANSYSYVDANGILHDTAWLPIGTILILLGLVLLLISVILFGVGKNIPKKPKSTSDGL